MYSKMLPLFHFINYFIKNSLITELSNHIIVKLLRVRIFETVEHNIIFYTSRKEKTFLQDLKYEATSQRVMKTSCMNVVITNGRI